MPGKTTAACPHCRAENFAHRRECWRCKRTLPTSFALGAVDDVDMLGIDVDRTGPPPDRYAIEDALSKAVVASEHDTEDDPLPYGSGSFGKRLVWMLRRRSLFS